MSPTQRLLLGLYAATIAMWVIRHFALTLIFRTVDNLKSNSPRIQGPDLPLVTAIIPAKDEEATIADCLRSVLAQDYPHLEILVVDDRSTDRTGAIVADITRTDPRVRLLTIDHLPTGWTGKTHALHVAAGEARGDWLWFLDADTLQRPECLPIVLAYAEKEGAALASLLPELRCGSFWEEVVQPLASIALVQSFPLFLVHNPRARRYFANGQFILIRRDAYKAAGGHEAVKERLLEDIQLAGKVKGLGRTIRVATAKEISSTRMYTTLPQIVRGWSRIFYDALDGRFFAVLWKALDPLIFSQPGHVALIAAVGLLLIQGPTPFAECLLGLSVAHHLLAATVLYRLYRQVVARPALAAAWYPLAGLVFDVIIARALVSCVTGKVTWRGTHYLAGRSRVT